MKKVFQFSTLMLLKRLFSVQILILCQVPLNLVKNRPDNVFKYSDRGYFVWFCTVLACEKWRKTTWVVHPEFTRTHAKNKRTHIHAQIPFTCNILTFNLDHSCKDNFFLVREINLFSVFLLVNGKKMFTIRWGDRNS